MNRHLYQLKKLKTSFAAAMLVAAGLVISIKTNAQIRPTQPPPGTFAKVSISLNIFPPYSPYYADYSGSNASKVSLLIQNLSADPLKIKLAGQLTGDNGVSIATYTNYVPLRPIILGPHAILQLNGTSLKDIFDGGNISVRGIDKGKLAISSRLPEGNYTLCLQAVDYDNSKSVLSDSHLGCSGNFNITYPEAPQLASPVNGSTVFATNPQAILFNWFNAGAVPIGTQYNITMAEMPDNIAASPTQVLDATTFPMLSQNLSTLNYLYNVFNLQLKPGRKYAWRVKAIDPTGKTLFKNKGVSAASYFIYGENKPRQIETDHLLSNLNVTTPSCTVRGGPSITMGPHLDLKISWLWREQIESIQQFDTLDVALIKHFTKMATDTGMVKLGKYQMDFVRLSDKNKITFYSTAPVQDFSLTDSAATAKGFKTGESYTVKITAFNSLNKIIDQTTSCPWLLKKEVPETNPKLNISGRLTYALDKQIYHGANNTSITLQLVDGKSSSKKYKNQYSVPVTTDANGNFKAQLSLMPSDTGKKYAMLIINSPYYKQLDTNVRVTIPKLNYVTAGGQVKLLKDTLRLGALKTSANVNNLTVHIKKGFPATLNEEGYNKLFGTYSNFGNEVPIDNITVDTMSRVPDGTLVRLYRKTKAADIPLYEADVLVDANKTVILPGIKQPVKEAELMGYIKVAEATTHDGAKGQSKVVFNHLLCNFTQGDEYYIKVILNDTGNNPDELVGPEQLYTYKPNVLPNDGPYNNSVNYNIISQKPPMAHVKGRVMYQWPSTPGVLHPYASQPVRVYMHLETVMNGGAKADNCQTLVYTQTGSGPNASKPQPWAYNEQYSNIIVGQAVTDANGNFDIPVFTPYQMGTVKGVTATITGNPCNPNDNQPKTDDPNQADNNIIKGGVREAPGGAIAGKGGPVENGGGYQFGASQVRQINEIDFKGGSFDFKNAGVNGALNNLYKDGFKGKEKDGGAVVIKALNGPAIDDNYPEAETMAPESDGTVERYFSLDGIPNVKSFGNKSNPLQFVVQPFQTIDLGIITTEVDEIRKYAIKVKVDGIKSDEDAKAILAGAKLVIHRVIYKPDELDFKPDGEGSEKHPMQPLLHPKFGQDNKPVDIEWVIDHPFNLDAHNSININNLRLIPPVDGYAYYSTQYEVEVTPDPEGTGGYFKLENFDIKPLKYRQDTLIVTVKPAKSRISGRVINQITNKPIAKASVMLSVSNLLSFPVITDKDGYFEYINGTDKALTFTQDGQLHITATVDGYTQVGKIDESITVYGQNNYHVINMKPNKTISFATVDAVNGAFVKAYAMDKDSSIVDNMDGSKKFTLNVPDVGDYIYHIIPVDPAYFDEFIESKDNQPVPAKVKMYLRHHRMQFHLVGNKGPLDVNAFKIIINNINSDDVVFLGPGNKKSVIPSPNYQYRPVYDKGASTISFDFANVSVNNYTIQVIDTAGSGYIPQVFNLSNEESRAPEPYEVNLVKGATISGNVTYNGTKIKNVRVYLDYMGGDATADAKSLLEAFTSDDGSYKIAGVPITADGTHIKVHATLSTNALVKGLVKDQPLTVGGPNTVNFDLVSMPGPVLDNLWGFPLAVETVSKIGNDNYLVSGIVDLGKNNSPFKMLGANTKIRVSNITFKPQDSHYIATDSFIPLEATASLKMQYLDQYNVKLESPNSFLNQVQPLYLEKNGTGGIVNAHVSITDNSFNYPSSYLSFQDKTKNPQTPIPFYLFDPKIANNSKMPVIGAVYSTPAQNINYHLSNAVGDSLTFSFIGFKTTADPANSYIDAKTRDFHLDVTFSGPIPHSDQGYAKVHLKDLTLDGNAIKPIHGTDAIIVDLQTWKLYVKDWIIDPKLGGISSSTSYVHTDILDIPAGNFNLRSDLFVLEKFDVSKLSLGGAIDLTVLNPAGAHFLYDEACGSDHKGHWRFSASGKGDTAAAIIPIPAIDKKITGTNLKVDYFQLVSYNKENIVGLSSSTDTMKMFNNNKFNFFPTSISANAGSFILTGSSIIDVPRVGVSSLDLVYTKNGGMPGVSIGNMAPINFEGKGYVQFTSKKAAPFKTDSYITSIAGSVVEPGQFNPIPCTLSFGAPLGGGNGDNGTIILQKDYKLRLDGESQAGVITPATADQLSLSIGANDKKNNVNMMSVGDNKDWSTLSFSGVMNDPQSNDNSAGGDKMSSKPSVFRFDVLGDVNASTEGVSVDNINTPLGDMKMSYDFKTHELHGSLHMNEVTFGSYKFTGDIQTTIGPDGTIMLGAGSLNTGALLVQGFGTLNVGMLFGNTKLTNENITTVTEYSKAPQNICWLNQNKDDFKGFFLTGGYDIINEHHGFDIGIASVYFNAVLGVEASLGANFPKKNYMALIGAHGDVDAGLDAITGTSISGGMSAHLTALGTYSTNGFAVAGDAGVTVRFTVSQYVPILGTQSFSASKGAMVKFGLGGGQKAHVDFSLSDDGNKVDCDDSFPKQ